MKSSTTERRRSTGKMTKGSWNEYSPQIFASHYAAKVSDEQLDKVIHIQKQKEIAAHDIVVSNGEQFYIEKVDHIKDTLPPITKLSLIKLEKHKQKEIANGEQ